MISRTFRLLIPLVALAFLVAACSDATDPNPGDTATGTSTGSIDPGAGSFVLHAVDVPMPDGPPVRIELVGSDLVLDDDGEHIDLTVALRNAGDRALPAPATVWLHRFEPSPVYVDNADTLLPTMKQDDDFSPVTPIFGFIYDDEFGDDGMLEAQEMSAGRTWRFRTMEQASFSFATRIEAGPGFRMPVIAGYCFYDENRNGIPDPGEHPLLPGLINILAPDGSHFMLRVNPEGRFAHEVTMAGLYELEWIPGPETVVFVDLEFTTPNPRHVLITSGPDGELRSFLGAHVGAVTRGAFLPPEIRFTDTPLDSLHFAPWTLLEVTVLENRLLAPRVAFSGCEPGHPFSLWTNGGFMESEPVQVDMVLVHDVDEACDAAFEGGYMFDLQPLIASYREAYGQGVLVMNLIDYEGHQHPIRLEIPEIKPRD